MYGFGGGMGGFGGGGPQFQNAVSQHLGNMMGGGAAHGMGNQMGYAPSPGYNPQQGQMLMNPNYGQLGQGMSNQFEYNAGMKFAPHYMPEVTNFAGYGGGPTYGNGQQISGLGDQMQSYGQMGQRLSAQLPGYGGMGQQSIPAQGGGMGGYSSMGGGAPRMPRPANFGMGGGAPTPDGGPMRNPDMQRQYANGDQYYNAKGNLRMRYRDGGQMAGQAPPRPY